jgi:prephenate dehydrogenase
MAQIPVAILGLGRVGTSLGLALKRHKANGGDNDFAITGYDTIAENIKQAKAMGAIDTPKHRPADAVREKAIVFVTLPYGEVKTAYKTFAPVLKHGTVVLDFSTLKRDIMQTAQAKMPEGTHLVCAAPIYNPRYLFDSVDETNRATEDLFDDGVMMLMPSVSCAENAITLANDLTSIVGASAQYFDPHEHDALIPAAEVLPTLMGIAYFTALQENKGWDDIRRLTNPAFGVMTHNLFDTHPDDLLQMWQDSGAQLLRYLDSLMKALGHLRELIEEDDTNTLSGILEDKAIAYSTWINHRKDQTWHKDKLDVKTPTLGDQMQNMFGGLFTRKRDQDED